VTGNHRACALAALAILLGLPVGVGSLSAQASGRWRLILSPSPNTEVHADLRLVESDGQLSGTLVLESSDSAPNEIAGTLSDAGGQLEFTVGSSGPRYVGRIIGDEMFGTAFRGDQPDGVAWLAERADPTSGFYIPLPKFRMRQLVLAGERSMVTIPGGWFASMDDAGIDADQILETYTERAARSGVPAANEPILRTYSYLQSMALWWRDSLLVASQASLELVRAGIRDDTTRAQFDLLFRPNGRWQLDIHQVAAHRVQQKFPHVTWEALRPALELPGVQQRPLPPHTAAAPLLTYRLFVLSRTDSAAFASRLAEMRAVEPEAAGVLERMLLGYAEAIEWYPRAMRFLLETPWFDGRSPADLLLAGWPDQTIDTAVPEIRTKLYGLPDGAPRIAPSDSFMELLVEPLNWTAGRWLEEQGFRALLGVLGRLPPEIEHTVLESEQGRFDVTSVAQLRQNRASGFLEPVNAIVIAPGYHPVLALETVIHEWVHVLQQRSRPLESYARPAADAVWWYSPDPFVAEGLAEWYTELVLRPIVDSLPLFGLGEAEKRAAMVVSRPDDPHLIGYRLFRLLHGADSDTGTLIGAASVTGNNVNALLDDYSGRFPGLGGSHMRDRMLPVGTVPRIVPEVMFQIDGLSPLPLERRLIPPTEDAP
jgi:hypothetical protein